jgi:hypothetical protein
MGGDRQRSTACMDALLLAANGSTMAHLRFILNPIAGNPEPLTNVAHTMSSTAYVKSLKCIALWKCS